MNECVVGGVRFLSVLFSVDSGGPTEAAAGWPDGDREEAATGHQGPEANGGHPRQRRHQGADPATDGQEDADGGCL